MRACKGENRQKTALADGSDGGEGGSQRGVLAGNSAARERGRYQPQLFSTPPPPPPPRAAQRARTATPTGPPPARRSVSEKARSSSRNEARPKRNTPNLLPGCRRARERAVVARYVKGATCRVCAGRARGRSGRDRARSAAARLCNAPPPSLGRKIEREGRGSLRAHPHRYPAAPEPEPRAGGRPRAPRPLRAARASAADAAALALPRRRLQPQTTRRRRSRYNEPLFK